MEHSGTRKRFDRKENMKSASYETTDILGQLTRRAALIAGIAGGGIVAVLPTAGGVVGQQIQIRTIPVATGDQFLLVPSSNLGMAGLRFAVDDSVADGWSNPAKGVFLGESAVFGAPTAYSVSQNAGDGLSLPLAALLSGKKWFGGVSVALQEVRNSLDGSGGWVIPEWSGWRDAPTLSEVSSRNLYGSGFIGTRLGDGGWSAGVGVSTASLEAMDGVDLLYGGASRIDQSGSINTYRAGVYRAGERDNFSASLIRSVVDMEHEVTYVDVTWPDTTDDMLFSEPIIESRVETNLDKTRTWGMQFAWDRKLDAPGWRIGASLTGNRKTHPKIPNYNIQNIPRDPGNSMAYEFGFGISRTRGNSLVGLDIALQPIASDTWQEADEAVIVEGDILLIPKGGKTIENDFSFLNAQVRLGMQQQLDQLRLQLGIEGRSYSYSLEQTNNIEGTVRDQDESWMEWTPAFSALFELDGLDIQYGLRVTTGAGIPGTAADGNFGSEMASPTIPGNDFVVAPDGPLTLVDANVVTHQLWVRVPIH